MGIEGELLEGMNRSNYNSISSCKQEQETTKKMLMMKQCHNCSQRFRTQLWIQPDSNVDTAVGSESISEPVQEAVLSTHCPVTITM